MWQDILISTMNVVFAWALVPQIYKSYQQKRSGVSLLTSSQTVGALWVIAICYVTLGLYFSAILISISGLLWFVIMVQRLYYKR